MLVTGCSSGIGRATAETFLDDGWRVYAAVRDAGDAEDLGAAGATVVELDVTAEGDAVRVVDRIVDEAGGIDCLVNNAGYGQFGPLEDVPTEAVREQFEVNVFGPHRLIRAVLPHMRERGSGTVVNVSSVDDRLPMAGIGAYNGSKFALAGMSAALRQEVSGRGVDVAVVEPGLVATAFYDRALSTLPEAGDRTEAYRRLYRVLEGLDVLGNDVPGVCTPSAVADTVLAAATADSPDPRYQAGPLGKSGVLAAEALPAGVRDRLVRAGVAAASTDPVQRALAWVDDRQST